MQCGSSARPYFRSLGSSVSWQAEKTIYGDWEWNTGTQCLHYQLAYLHNTFKLEGESSKWHTLISYDFCKFKEKHFVFPFVTFATFVRQNLPCDKLGGSFPYEGQFNFIHRNILYQKLQLLILACNDTIKILQCYFLYKSINVMFKL